MCCVLGLVLGEHDRHDSRVCVCACVLRNIWRDVSERVAGAGAAAAASHGSLVSARSDGLRSIEIRANVRL